MLSSTAAHFVLLSYLRFYFCIPTQRRQSPSVGHSNGQRLLLLLLLLSSLGSWLLLQ